MTVKSLFNIILKVIGIFFIQNIIGYFTTMFSILTIYTSQEKTWPVFNYFLSSVIAVFIYILLSFLFIFKTKWVLRVLRLEKAFDKDPIPLNIKSSTILSIAIMVIGGLMFANNLPELGRQLFMHFKPENNLGHPGSLNQNAVIVAIKVTTGVVLICFQKPIVSLIERNSVQTGA